MEGEGHPQGPPSLGEGGHQDLMLPILPWGPVHEDGKQASLGEAGGEEEEVGREGPGVLPGGVVEEAPEAVEAALGEGGQGGSAGEVGEGRVKGSGEEEGQVGARGFSEGMEDRVDPGGGSLEEGVVGSHTLHNPLFVFPCQAPTEQSD